jgi:hypothetical protein
MRKRILLMLVLSLSMILSAPPALATGKASEKPASRGAIATYHGRAIDLSKGWAGAQICEVWTKTDVRCYATQQEMRAAHAKILAASGVQGPYGTQDLKGCPGGPFEYEWVCLYEYTNWGGRRLQFKDPDIWQDLNTWGFADKASSWAKTRNPGFKLLDYRTGTDAVYYFRICGPASAAAMPAGWDNIANSIWVYRQYPC